MEGPTIIIKKICNGCNHLKEEYWKDYGENDYTESGTSMFCKLENRHITNYGNSQYIIPDWCPFAGGTE